MSIVQTFETLYNTTVGTGREKQWSIRVENNGDGTFSIITEHGIVGGAQVLHNRVITEGKNIGRKNETTPEQQAISEAQSDFNKKVRQGYAPKQMQQQQQQQQQQEQKQIQTCTAAATKTAAVIEDIDEDTDVPQTAATLSKCIKPMLAQEFKVGDSAKKSSAVTYPVYVQPKLDGVRCLVYYSHGQLVFQSRQNTIYEPFAHLEQELRALFAGFPSSQPENVKVNDIVFDGELYIHKKGFNSITSIVRKSKRNHIDAVALEYHVYDYISLSNPNEPYAVRKLNLDAAFHSIDESECCLNKVKEVATYVASNLGEVKDCQRRFIEEGYEGVMIRTMNGVYKQQNRSKDLQKYKTFQDAEFIVTGYHEGTGAHAGTPVFECLTADGKPFSVTFADTIENKRRMMLQVDKYIGQPLTVKYQELSPDGIPRFPVGMAFRNYE